MECIDCGSGLTQTNFGGARRSCIACGAKWENKSMSSFRCVSCPYSGPEPKELLDLIHNGRVGWFECPHCSELNNESDVRRWSEPTRSVKVQ